MTGSIDSISRQAALAKFEPWLKVDGYSEGERNMLKAVLYELKVMPSADVAPVRHGRWETDGMPMDDGEYLMTRCTVCGMAYEYGHNENYCGYCGARMDGE